MVSPIIDRVYLRSDGIEMFLGSLEAAIMRAVWSGHHTGRALMHELQREHNPEIAYTTVATTANRLAAKQLLLRTRRPGTGGHYRYIPMFEDEAAFINACVTATFDRLLAEHTGITTEVLHEIIPTRRNQYTRKTTE